MQLFSVGPLYIGTDKESFFDYWKSSTTVSIHLGIVRVEWDRPRKQIYGSVQARDHEPSHGESSQGI